MDLIDDFQQNRVAGRVVVRYYAFHLFQIAFTVAPIAVLVGVLVTLGVLARNKEITAMKAGGISVYRAAMPVLGMGLVSSLLLYGLQEWVLPQTNKVAAAERNVIKGRPAQSSDQFDRRWMLASDDRFYNFDYIVERDRSPRRGVAEGGGRGGEFAVYGFSIYDVDPGRWELDERVFASRAAWNPAEGAYELDHGWRRTTGARPTFQRFLLQRVRAIGRDPGGEIEPPAYFKREEKPSDTMGFGELGLYIRSLETRGFDVAKLRVQLYRKLAFPMVGLVMTLLAVPFSFVVARRGALYGVGIAIVIAIVYWAVLGIFEALGNNALLHAGPRRLGPEPDLRRRRPLPDPHARDLEPFVGLGQGEASLGQPRSPVDADVGEPDLPRVPGFTLAWSSTNTTARVSPGSSRPSLFGLSVRKRLNGSCTSLHSVEVRAEAIHHSRPSSAEAGFGSRSWTQSRYSPSARTWKRSPLQPPRSRASRLTSAHQVNRPGARWRQMKARA